MDSQDSKNTYWRMNSRIKLYVIILYFFKDTTIIGQK